MKKLIFAALVVAQSVCQFSVAKAEVVNDDNGAEVVTYVANAPKVSVKVQGQELVLQDHWNSNLISEFKKSAYSYVFEYDNSCNYGDWALTFECGNDTFGIIYGNKGIIFNRDGVITECSKRPADFNTDCNYDPWATFAESMSSDSSKKVRYAYARDVQGTQKYIVVFGR